MTPDMKGMNGIFAVQMRVKRKGLKWYQKLLNIISGNKEQNWEWIPVYNTTNSKGE